MCEVWSRKQTVLKYLTDSIQNQIKIAQKAWFQMSPTYRNEPVICQPFMNLPNIVIMVPG